jgi:nitrate reductase NapAB chaperone NapD
MLVIVLTSEKNEETLQEIAKYATVKGILQTPLCKNDLLAITSQLITP